MSAHSLSVPPVRVGKLLCRLLERHGRPLSLNGRAITPDAVSAACAPDGFLPAFLLAAESLWHSLTGTGFGLTIKETTTSATGVEVVAIKPDSLVVVLLCLLEVLERASPQQSHLSLNDLTDVWDYGLRLVQVSGERVARVEAA